MPTPEIITFADEAEVAQKLMAEVTKSAKDCVGSKKSFSFCIPAGSVVSALKGLDPSVPEWANTSVFFTGERLGQNKSYSAALDSFCKKCNIKDVFYPLVRPMFSNGGDPLPQFCVDEAADAYTSLLKHHPAIDNSGAVPSFDLLLLGVGEDGHCGSLHPNSAHIKAAGDGTITFGICKPDKNQIAISMDVMRAAKKVILCATGAKKADVVKRILAGESGPDLPASLVQGSNVVWYVDKASNP